MTRSGGLVALILLGCGGAGGSGGTTPRHGDGPSFAVMEVRRIPVGASWDEEVSFVRTTRTVTQVLDGESVQTHELHVDFVAHVEVVDTSTTGGLARFVVRRAEVTDAEGSRSLLSPGDELSVVGGLVPHVSSPGGPMPDATLASLRHVVALPSLGAAELSDAERGLGPPGGHAAVGDRWEMDHAAVQHYFSRGAPHITIAEGAFEAFGELERGAVAEGHACLTMRTTFVVHDMTLGNLPPGAVVDDVEVQVVAEAGWPTDLDVPELTEHYRSEMTSRMHVVSDAGVRVDVTAVETEERRRTRTAITLP